LRTKHIFPLIGTTSSGKRIYSAYRPDEVEISIDMNFVDFSYADYFEAYCLFEYLSLRTFKKHSSTSVEFLVYLIFIDIIKEHLGHRLEMIKTEMKLMTVIDVVKLGASFVSIEFKDF
jgi:hypothetical protein